MWLDLRQSSKNCLDRIFDSVKGLKVLLLDQETAGILSSLVSHAFLLEKGICLTHYVEHSGRDRISSVSCVALVRPTTNNFELLKSELKYPLYSEYNIYFCGRITHNSMLEQLAESDEFEMVRLIKEIYLDYFVCGGSLCGNHFSFNLTELTKAEEKRWKTKPLIRIAEGLLSTIFSLGLQLPIIRYEKSSVMALELAQTIQARLHDNNSSITTRGPVHPRDTAPILLILDRRFDMVTPLLFPWTYQAMLHELLGLNNARLILDSETISLDHEQDTFYRENSDRTFGEVGENLKKLVLQYQEQNTKYQQILGHPTGESGIKEGIHSNPQELPSMKRFIEEYPEFRKMSSYASKHVKLLGKLSRLVEEDHLMALSELEQTIATDDEYPQRQLETLLDIIKSSSPFNQSQKLRLVLIFALRFHNSRYYQILRGKLCNSGLSNDDITLVDFAVQMSQSDVDIGAPSPLTGTSFSMLNLRGKGISSLSNVDQTNVYTRHMPPLIDIVDALVRGRLSNSVYPILENMSGPPSREVTTRPQELIVFFVGGTTYMEGQMIQKYNELYPGVSVILGGTDVLNSEGLLYEMKRQMGMK